MGGSILTALEGINVPFMHPRKLAGLIGCSPKTLINAMDNGVVPVCTPFATGRPNERPTRYINLTLWAKRVHEEQTRGVEYL